MFPIADFITLTQKFYIVKLELYENFRLGSQLWRVTDKNHSIYMSKKHTLWSHITQILHLAIQNINFMILGFLQISTC